jgi:hypothetical protein
MSATVLCTFGRNNVRQIRKFLRQIRVAFVLNSSLVWFLFVLIVDLVNKFHTLDDLTDRTESLAVKKLIASAIGVNKHLSRSRVRARCGKGDCSSSVGLDDGIILDNLAAPLLLHRRVALLCSLQS